MNKQIWSHLNRWCWLHASSASLPRST